MNCLRCDRNKVEEIGWNRIKKSVLWHCNYCDFAWSIKHNGESYYGKSKTDRMRCTPIGILLIASSEEIL